jgi:hypothetical protein
MSDQSIRGTISHAEKGSESLKLVQNVDVGVDVIDVLQ